MMAVLCMMLYLLAGIGLSAGLELTCPGSCSCNLTTGTIEECTGVTELPQSFPNASLIKTLNLANNDLTVLNTTLGTFHNLKTLDLTNNSIKLIGKDAFRGMDHLQTVSMKDNRIQFIRPGTFVDLPSLLTLELPKNNISTLDTGGFDNLTQLLYFDLSYNQINMIYTDTFGFLPNVTHLDLGHNKLTKLHWRIFQSFPKLSTLILAANMITVIDSQTFNYCTVLKSLNLANNVITTMHEKAFHMNGTSQYLTLTSLILTNNSLTTFPSAVNGLNGLQYLMLESNNIVAIPADAMTELPALKVLFMTDNPEFKEIQPGAFRFLTSLRSAILNNNKGLTSLPDKLFKNQKLLHVLFMANCSIETFQENLVDWKSVKSVNLSHNPLLCDCRMTWMSKPDIWGSNTKNMSSNLVCTSPVQLKNKRVVTLNDESLHCVDHTNGSNRLINGIIFTIVTIVLVSLCALVLKFRRSMILRWRYYRYTRQTDDVPFMVDNGYSDYPTDKDKLRMSDLDRDV